MTANPAPVTFGLSPFVELRDRVYRAVAQPEGVNVGLVVGSTGALVVDTGSSPDQGRAIRAAAEAVSPVPLVAVAVTHAHYDHAFGLAAFADLPSYGHDCLAAELAGPEAAAQAQRLGFDPALLVPPSLPFSLARVIDLGDRRVELVHFGRGHTAGDVVAIVPDADVVFAGDLLEQSAPPSMGPDCQLKEWPSALDGILGVLGERSLVVPGHGEVVDRLFAFAQRAAISAVYGQAEHLIGQGVAEADALAAGDWPFDERTMRVVVPRAYAQLAADGRVPRTRLPLLGGLSSPSGGLSGPPATE